MTDDETGFPAALGKVAPRALIAAGITSVDELSEYTAQELLALHGVGPKAVRILREELLARGLRFREG